MLRYTFRKYGTRTPGYVFWRQRNLIELEKSQRTYLINERPYPLSEVTRRMARIRAKYSATSDSHEQNLLRGEYKFFTGKLVDLRHAQVHDMLAFIEFAAFFGFWDVAQLDQCLDELNLRLTELTPMELTHLLCATAGVRKQQSQVYRSTAEHLAQISNLDDELAVEDVLKLIKACESEDPPALIDTLLARVSVELDRLSVEDAVGVLETLACASQRLRSHYEALIQELKSIALSEGEVCDSRIEVDGVGSSEGTRGNTLSSPMAVARLAEALAALDTLDAGSSKTLCRIFVTKHLPQCCPRSLAMMMYATDSLTFAQSVEDRVLYLANRFSTAELFAVMKIYCDAVQRNDRSIELQQRLRTQSSSSTASTVATRDAQPSILTDLLVAASEKSLDVLMQERRECLRIIQELLDVLVAHMDSAAVSVPNHILIGILKCIASIFPHRKLFNASFDAVTKSLCSRVIGCAREMEISLLIDFVVVANALSPFVLQAAVLASLDAFVSRMKVPSATRPKQAGRSSESAFVSRDEAVSWYNVLGKLQRLSPQVQRKINAEVLPLVRRAVCEDDVDLLHH